MHFRLFAQLLAPTVSAEERGFAGDYASVSIVTGSATARASTLPDKPVHNARVNVTRERSFYAHASL